ncbi:MAG: flagellar motor protein MotB, partial [Fibrobacterota bacterium]|nr:flagellar motor protein MotB [Fibrobacterota bacterium]
KRRMDGYRTFMKNNNISIQGLSMYRIILFALCLSSLHAAPFADEIERTRPTWWFGAAAGANLNFYSGTAQVLNPGLTTPVPFHKGFGTGLFLAPHLEYRHDSIWGGMLQVGYDNRDGTFDDVICPCGETATLKTELSYFSIEPSLRIAPFAGSFYVYGGPRLAFNWSPSMAKGSPDDANTFAYTQEFHPSVEAELADMRTVVFSGQIGLGYDIPLSSPHNKTQVDLSPFISYQPYFGQQVRSKETWAVSTLRLGATLKFGNGEPAPQGAAAETGCDVTFTVRAPKAIIVKRRVRETFPLRNYVFFEEGSTEMSDRYVKLDKAQAASFKEEQLQEVQPKNASGRSLRQMTVYYNIVNTVGDRMKRSPGTSVVLSGASDNNIEQGKARAQTIKRYLVDVFGIDSARIATEGRDKPRIPSEGPGNFDIPLQVAGNNRVDIESTSPEMMIQVGGDSHYVLKPVQIVADVEDPLDSHVIFKVSGAGDVLASWSLEIKDDHGKVQLYGPFTGEQTSISGSTILAGKTEGEYKVAMIGQKQDGKAVRREATVHLVRRLEPVHEALRFSILFDYGQSKSKGTYEKFINQMVVPLVSDSSVIVIHGYTDIIGDEAYNQKLSEERVKDTRTILEQGIPDSKARGITFETFGFGENPKNAPFDNNFPEERFYNRSVFIDIVPK